MTKFIREIKDFDKLKDKLENDPFLIKVNKELIQKGKILLTFRNNNSTMYYKGRQFCNMRRSNKDASGNIVSYSPEINNLFLPVMRSNVLEKGKREIIGEDVYLRKTSGICSFSSVLSEILDNMDKEKDEEAFQVSNMYRFSPMVQNNSSTVILLDIEAAFAETKIDRDRIDVVLYNIDEKQLIFVEVKRRSDGRLYPNPTTKARAEIFGQMESYREIIKINKDIIVKQYNKVIDYYNILANKTQPDQIILTVKDIFTLKLRFK